MSWARIERPTVTRALIREARAAGTQIPQGQPDDFNAYMQRLVALIPAEVVALYLTFHTAAGPHGDANGSFVTWWPVICLALVVLVRIAGTREQGGSCWTFQKIAVAVAAISFVLWIYAIGDKILGVTVSEPIWIAATIGIWTIIVPYFYKG